LIKSLYGFFQRLQWLLIILLLEDFRILKCNNARASGKHEGKILTYKLPGPHPIGGCVAGGVWGTMNV
jgi:hypothetical protein